MTNFYRIGLWNANGLAQHSQDIKVFITTHKIDIMLISETHFTDMNYFKIPNFVVYSANHPDNTAHGGSAVLIKNTIRHYELPNFQQNDIQASSVVIEDWMGSLTISSVYCPPRFNISDRRFSEFFRSLGPRFLAGGDYNAKHVMWGSRLANPRGRSLLKCLDDNNLNHVSTGSPTYWPTDLNKIPDLLDFFVTRGISQNYMDIVSSLDLSSDHSPLILTISSTVMKKEKPPSLTNKHTNWDQFRDLLNNTLRLTIPLKCGEDIDNAVELFNSSIQSSAWKSTPKLHNGTITHQINYPLYIKQQIAEKRRLRRIWQNSRNGMDKTNFNRASRRLKRLLQNLNNMWFQEFTSNLSPTEATDYSLWKVTKKMKQPQTPIPPISKPDGTWAKTNQEKADIFANHFSNVFKPNPVDNNFDIGPTVEEFLDSPTQLTMPIIPFKPSEVKEVIGELHTNKSPGYDLITGKVLKELPRKAIIFLAMLFNAVLRLEYIPSQWKVAEIVVILKPGKQPHQVGSYRPISLLPIPSKLFEKLFLKRLNPLLSEQHLVPDHQFGFRRQHSTIEQVHRVVNEIRQTLENRKFCSAAFLDISQAFDKVWHDGLLFKIKSFLPHTYYNVIKSYLSQRYFRIKYQNSHSKLQSIGSGVPQGSVLGPLLYTIFTADIPTHPATLTATFADDTAVLASHQNSFTASQILQDGLNSISDWLKRWRIQVNENKSVHVTFTLNFENCPNVFLNNTQLTQRNDVKYLGIHLDKRLTWRSHIWNKRLHLNSKFSKMYWLFGKNSHLSTESKLLLYKVILKPVWTYGIQLWGSASSSNLKIIQRFQNKVLRTILQAPWYVKNAVIHKDTGIAYVHEEITKFSSKYLQKLETHENYLAINLLDNSDHTHRLKRHDPLYLGDRW